MKRIKQLPIWIIALWMTMTVTNLAWAADTQKPTPKGYLRVKKPRQFIHYPVSFTPTEISVKWNPATDDVTPQNKLRYRVLWKRSPDGAWKSSHSGQNYLVNTTSYTIKGLEPNTEYIVRVGVLDEADNGAWYDEKTVKTKQVADTQAPQPGCSGKVTIGTVTSNSATVSWCAATDDVTPSNQLEYFASLLVNKVFVTGGVPRSKNITSYTLTGLSPNTEYEMRLFVYDQVDNNVGYEFVKFTTKPAGIAVTGVTLSPASLTLIQGKTGQLKATVAPATATDQTVTWSSNNTAVATVNTHGTVKAVAPGTAVITVKTNDGNKTATATVTVEEILIGQIIIKVSSVTLNRNSVTINGDYEEVQLTATVAPSDATDKSLTWTSDDPQIASVDGKGLVKIHRRGKARITATSNDGSLRYDVCDFDVISTVGNQTVDGLRVYAADGALYLTLPQAETVHIYHVEGSLVKTLTLSAGDHVQPLPSGVYLVRVGDRVTKIVVK